MGTVVSRIAHALDSWIPSAQKETTDQRWRSRFLVQVLFLGMGICVVMAFFYVMVGVWQLVAQCGVVGLALALALLSFLRFGTFRFSSHLALGSVTVAFAVPALLERQLDGTGLAWFCVLPFVAALLLGRRALWVWVPIILATITGLYFHPLRWGVMDLAPHVQLARSLVLTLTILVFALSFESRQREVRTELERVNRAKSSFLANMSHELRTPMNGVLGLTEVLLQGELAAPQREHLELVQRSGRAMVSLVNDLLDFSKVEAGKLTLERADFALPALLDDVYGLYLPVALSKRLSWQVDRGVGLPPAVTGDALRLRQVLCNLVDNALKFTERGEVRLAVTPLPLELGGQAVHFTVEDSGPGITPEVAQRLFTPFEQADTSTTRRFGGTGLGLALSGQLVELMGGQIVLTPRPGGGTSFSFTVPLAPVTLAAPVASPVALPPTAGSRGRVLVVDDNAINLKVACALVKLSGFEPACVTDGRAALDRVRAEHFDLVLMDCHMPVMDGFEATRAIRALVGPRACTPIVALTAAALPEELAACRAAGMDECLTKPVNLQALQAALGRLVPPSPGN